MKFVFFASLLTAFASIGTAEQFEIPKGDPSGNALILPDTSSKVTVGQKFTIQWQPTPGDNIISLFLISGPTQQTLQLKSQIADAIQNSGSYDWTVDSALPTGNDIIYGIKLQVDGSDSYQYTQPFHLTKAEEGPTEVPETAQPPNEKPADSPMPETQQSPSEPVVQEDQTQPDHPVVSPPPQMPDAIAANGAEEEPTTTYVTEYHTVTDCNCPTDVPSPSGVSIPPPYSTGYPTPYGNSTNNNTHVNPNIPFTDAASHVKASGIFIALAAGLVILFL